MIMDLIWIFEVVLEQLSLIEALYGCMYTSLNYLA